MAIDPIFDRTFRRLYGKPCWGAENFVGSDIKLEFGAPHLEIREPIKANPKASTRVRELLARRQVTVRGDYHLWIWMCDWQILLNEKRIGSNRSTRHLDSAVYSLNGQKLVRFCIDAGGTQCRFEFDLGGVLVTRRSPSSLDAEADHWKLYEPSRYVVTLRNDGTFSRQRADRPCDAGSWKPVNSQRRRGRPRE